MPDCWCGKCGLNRFGRDEQINLDKLGWARWIWTRRHEQAPVSRVGWPTWFEKKFGENYFGYTDRLRKEKNGE